MTSNSNTFNGVKLLSWLVFITLFLTPYTSYSQLDTSEVEKKADSNTTIPVVYFKDVSDKLLLSTGTLIKSYTVGIENVNVGSSVSIKPTGSGNLGFGFNYRWLGLFVSFGLPASTEQKEKYGDTEKQDFQLNLYSNAFVVNAHYQRYWGFHITDINSGDSLRFDNEIVYKLPSLETYSMGVSGWYFFNKKKFSYKGAYIRNAIQKKSAGSPILGIYYGLDRAQSPTNLSENLPDSVKSEYDVLGFSSQTYGISAGYSYTFVYKDFFINATFVPGIGVKNVNFFTDDDTYHVNEGLTARLAFNMAIGYETRILLMGIRAFTSSRFFEANGMRVNTSTNSITIFVAKRFDVSRFVKKNSK